jgi:hypothetical protein
VGTSHTAGELAAKLGRLSKAVETNQRDAVNAAARATSDVMYREAMRSIGGPNLVGRKWGTMVRKATSTARPEAIVQYRGPVHWMESGTKPHTIVSRKVGSNRSRRATWPTGSGMFSEARRRGAVVVGGQPRAYARSRGSRARPFWDRAKTASAPVASQVMRRALVEQPIRSIF